MNEQYPDGMIPNFVPPDTRAGIHRNPCNDRDFWRYHYAGLAMQGMIINDSSRWGNDIRAAILCADALLDELEKGE